MKLIEILVKKHYEEGWEWPDKAHECHRHEEDSVCAYFYTESGGAVFGAKTIPVEGVEYLGVGDDGESVTREQYEAALAASKEMLVNKPVAWDGQGLPPVGQRCDFYSALEGRWLPVQIEAVTKDGVAFTWLTDELSYSGLDCVRTENALFRPSLSAEEMARIGIIDNFIKIMAGYIEGGLKPEIIRERLYEHLPLLPGVRVESPDED